MLVFKKYLLSKTHSSSLENTPLSLDQKIPFQKYSTPKIQTHKQLLNHSWNRTFSEIIPDYKSAVVLSLTGVDDWNSWAWLLQKFGGTILFAVVSWGWEVTVFNTLIFNWWAFALKINAGEALSLQKCASAFKKKDFCPHRPSVIFILQISVLHIHVPRHVQETSFDNSQLV